MAAGSGNQNGSLALPPGFPHKSNRIPGTTDCRPDFPVIGPPGFPGAPASSHVGKHVSAQFPLPAGFAAVPAGFVAACAGAQAAAAVAAGGFQAPGVAAS